MSEFSDLLSRSDAAIIPEQLAGELVEGVRRDSTVLALGTRIPVSTKDSRLPVLKSLPQAFWVTGDAGLKQTTSTPFQNENLTAEEMAALVPIPDNVIADSQFPLWDSVRPLMVEAIARRLDDAILWGNLKPASWGDSLYERAVATGMVVSADLTAPDFDGPQSVLQAAGLVANQGYAPTGVAVANGWQYRAAATRTPSLVANPIGASSPFPLVLGGLGIRTDPARWDTTKADALVCAWKNVLIGIRQDITMTTHVDGVVSDETGKIVLNAMTQDCTILRVVFRAGFLLSVPPNDVTDSQSIAEADRSVSAIVQHHVGAARKPVGRRH